MLSRKSEAAIKRANDLAFEARHEYCTTEHLMSALLELPEIVEIINNCGGNAELFKKDLTKFLKDDLPKVEDSPALLDRRAAPEFTLAVQSLIQRALFQVQASGGDEIEPHDLFVALFQSKSSFALKLLKAQKIDRLEVISYLSHGARDSKALEKVTEDVDASQGQSAEADPLLQFTQPLNDLARDGKIDPLIGRSQEMERMVQTLLRRLKNNPILVGEAGVGKTALAEGLALRIVQGQIPEPLKKAEVYSLDMGALLAGAKFRGDFEQRLKKVLNALEKKKKEGITPILFIDEIHTVIGAGSAGSSSLDAANLLKPMLSRGELRCIGSTTYQEYRNVFEKDHALARRFQKIDIPEPTQSEALEILKGLRGKFEKYHDVTYSDTALKAAVDLSVKHLSERFLPDKAIDLIDEAGAKARLANVKKVEMEDIETLVSQVARIPQRSVSQDQKERLKNLERDLKMTLFGQPQAISQVVTAIRLSRSGLRSGDKPVGSFLFCGPTGVGKTELSRQLALLQGLPIHRFDMSEYMEKHTVSRLIGAPPGYVGFDQAGLLTDALRRNPHCVVLLDEIEKAHPDIWNILLQVMDHGTLTDNFGRKADFKNAIIIMTSNVGAREIDRKKMGITTKDAPAPVLSEGASQTPKYSGDVNKEIERTFSPEFRNRLDAIVFFNPLNFVSIRLVVDRQLTELENQLLAKNVELEVSNSAKDFLAEKGYQPTLGARPMARLLQEEIRKPLSEEILFGKLEGGGKVLVDLVATDDSTKKLRFEIISKKVENSPPDAISKELKTLTVE